MSTRKSTAFVYDDAFVTHDTGPGHPERPERASNTLAHLQAQEWFADLLQLPARNATEEEIAAIHPVAYQQRVRAACLDGQPFLDSMDVAISGESYDVALLGGGDRSTLEELRQSREGIDVGSQYAVVPVPALPFDHRFEIPLEGLGMHPFGVIEGLEVEPLKRFQPGAAAGQPLLETLVGEIVERADRQPLAHAQEGAVGDRRLPDLIEEPSKLLGGRTVDLGCGGVTREGEKAGGEDCREQRDSRTVTMHT